MAGKYVLSLVTAALIGGIVTGFFPDGSFRRMLRCGRMPGILLHSAG